MNSTAPTIAVIDDSLSVRQFFQRCVEPLAVDFKAYASASEAMDSLGTHQPELLFLDIIMPEKDGLTFLQELRRIAGWEHTKVIVISSKDYMQDRAIAKKLGAVDFVAKPMNTQAIRDLIILHTGARQKQSKPVKDG
ncbi:MAG TPA: response regulator [Gammaproteobacteria bacterium]|nr:response regulator [Gammaproteobacteria bacterium]